MIGTGLLVKVVRDSEGATEVFYRGFSEVVFMTGASMI